jgi:hypothetical protein
MNKQSSTLIITSPHITGPFVPPNINIQIVKYYHAFEYVYDIYINDHIKHKQFSGYSLLEFLMRNCNNADFTAKFCYESYAMSTTFVSTKQDTQEKINYMNECFRETILASFVNWP